MVNGHDMCTVFKARELWSPISLAYNEWFILIDKKHGTMCHAERLTRLTSINKVLCQQLSPLALLNLATDDTTNSMSGGYVQLKSVKSNSSNTEKLLVNYSQSLANCFTEVISRSSETNY